MPSREEERSINKKSDLRYCPVHKCYYYEEFGCQQCAFGDFKQKTDEAQRGELKKCPKCGRTSLFWNGINEIYECLNKKCKGMFTVNQAIKAEAKLKDEPIKNAMPKSRKKSRRSKKRW